MVHEGHVSAVVERDASDMLRLEAERHFEDIDEDGSGFLDRHEIKRLAYMLGQELGDHEVNGAMKEMDTSGTGEVSFDDYYAWYSAQKAQELAGADSGGSDGAGADGKGGGLMGGFFARKKSDTRKKGRSLVSKAMRAERDTMSRELGTLRETVQRLETSLAEVQEREAAAAQVLPNRL